MSAQAFRRVAIVNRGEPAMRLINAVREWNAEGRRPAAHDRALHRRRPHGDVRPRGRRGRADRARTTRRHGPVSPTSTTPSWSGRCALARADAVWPGWGFVSEKAEFARLCRDLDIVFVGPSPEVMQRLGDKIASKRLAEEVGVPLAAWSGGPVADVDAAREHAETHRLPAHGQGDRGRRRPRHPPGRAGRGPGRGVRARLLRGRRRPRATPRCSWSGRSAAAGTSRCRSSPTPPATCGRSACATARCSGATRRCSRSRPPPRWTPTRSSSCAARPPRSAKAAGYVNAGTVEFLYEPERAAAVVPRGQHPAAGGAPGHRGHHRRRHRQAAAARRGRRQAGRDRPGDAAGARARHRGPAHRRGPRAGLRPRARPHRAPGPAQPGRASASTPAWRRATPSRRSSTP